VTAGAVLSTVTIGVGSVVVLAVEEVATTTTFVDCCTGTTVSVIASVVKDVLLPAISLCGA